MGHEGVFINQCYDELNLRAPEIVLEVHRAYVNAGAEMLETNTFGANRIKLAQYGLEEQVREINRAAAELAREAAGDAVSSPAPSVRSASASSRTVRRQLEEARGNLPRADRGAAEGGVDLFILETFADLPRSSRRFSRRATSTRDARHRADDDRQRRPHAVRRDARRRRAARSTRWAPTSSASIARSGPQAMLDAIEKMAPVTRARSSPRSRTPACRAT